MLLHKSYNIVIITPVIAASTYTSGYQVGGLNKLPEVVASDRSTALLQSLALVDKAGQNAALTLFLFEDLPTIASVDSQAFDLTDAQMVAKCLGSVDIATTAYKTSSSNSIATVANIGLLLRSQAGKVSSLPAGATKRDLWCVLKTTGTPTYVSTSDLVLKLGIEQH